MTLQNDQIAIVHGSTPSFNELTEITFQNHAEYAQKHGYVLKTTEFLTSELMWGKIRALQETFADPYIRRAFWIDADAIFTNLTLSLNEHLPNEKVVISCDIFGPNTGCIWLENCQEVLHLLSAMAGKGFELFAGRAWNEQLAFHYFSLNSPYNKIIHYVEQTQMNSYCNQLYTRNTFPRPQDGFGQWQPGHFILHMPGSSGNARLEVLKRILPLVKR